MLIADDDTNRNFDQKQVTINNNKPAVELKPNGGIVVVL